MPRTLVLARLLIDSWRDQSSQMELGETNLPGRAIPIIRFGGTCDDSTAPPRLTSLIELAATKWELR